MADDLDEKIARAMADSWHDQIARWYAGAGLPEPRRPPWDSEAHVWATIAAAARAAHEAALKDAGLVIVPRNLPDDVLASVIPFPDHLLAQHPDPDDPWHSSMRAATMADRMVLRQRWIELITASEEHE